MVRTNVPFCSWIQARYTKTILSIMNIRLGEASTTFLIDKKLVTKSFSTNLSFIESYLAKAELLRTLKVILVNVRKKLPLLKSGDASYVHPFIVLRTRVYALEFTLDPNKISEETLARYFRTSGINSFLSSNNIPLASIMDHRSRNPANPTDCIRLQLCLTSELINASTLVSLFGVVFAIPNILKCISTLHRKAVFTNGDGTITTVADELSE